MKIKKYTRSISFRVSDGEHELLKDAAEQRGLSMGMTARAVVLETLSGYDRKQEFLHCRLDTIDEDLKLILRISSLGAAAGSLPLDAEQQDVPALREKLKIHYQHSSDLGKSIVQMIEKGKL